MSKYVRISIMYHNDHFSLDDTSIFYVRVLQSENVDLTCEFQLQYVICYMESSNWKHTNRETQLISL